MALAAGDKLGPYEILSALGAGGMAEVYKARDTRLSRLVAIKVLPAERMADLGRKQRFTQEARAVSALNHPNIVILYDIAADGGRDYLVMEYIKGKRLDHLIPLNGLPLSDTLRYGVQIADALATAHAVGIVHRDVKPSNIMVTDQGLVKVLDFGLAKLIEPLENGPFGTTATMPMHEAGRSAEGAIVGTVAYMSPEQAEGKTIDPRSDIFSFGAVLYEMKTRQKAFQRETRAATLCAVMRELPGNLPDSREGIPPDLNRVISWCLHKDPAQRMQHMGDVKIALRQIDEESETGRSRTGLRACPSHWAFSS